MALVFITGGARSGKSRVAQDLARARHELGQPVVVGVFGADDDPEMAARIQRHRDDRPQGFETLVGDGTTAWLASIPQSTLVVIDCLGTWFGRVLIDAWHELARDDALMGDSEGLPEGLEVLFASRTAHIVDALASRAGDLIVVSNEVGAGVVPAYPSGRLFRDELGRANAQLAGLADAAYLAVAGRLVCLSDLPRDAAWPVD